MAKKSVYPASRKRKKHLTIKQRRNRAILVLVLIIILGIITGICIANRDWISLTFKGYDSIPKQTILEQEDWQIERYKDSPKVDTDFWDKEKNSGYYIDYQLYDELTNGYFTREEVIDFVDGFYKDYYNPLQRLDYTFDQMSSLWPFGRLDDFKLLVDGRIKYSDIKEFYKEKCAQLSDAQRYIDSGKKGLDAVMSVPYPNVDSRGEATGNIYISENPASTLIFLKKGYGISKDYVPKDLVESGIPAAEENKNTKMRKDAAEKLKEMAKAAEKEGLYLLNNSSYRSGESQQEIYEHYFRIYPESVAKSLVAVPGFSEHQTGLAIDITSKSVENGERMVFGDTEEAKWLKENSYKYGFILRYPEEDTDITGATFEPWHFRYVGVDVAKEIYKKKWTLEEYVIHQGFDYRLHKQEDNEEYI